MKRTFNESVDRGVVNRRGFLGTTLCACGLIFPVSALSTQLVPSLSESLTKEQRDSMTAAQVIEASIG